MRFHVWPLPILAAVIAGCGGRNVSGPAPDRGRGAVSGQWIDLGHTAAGDTSVWILAPGGRDDALRLSLGRDGVSKSATTRYGRWFVRPADPRPELCFTRRPGREAPSCSSFRVDTIVVGGHPRRRLWLGQYRGSHRTGDRELWERGPLAPGDSR